MSFRRRGTTKKRSRAPEGLPAVFTEIDSRLRRPHRQNSEWPDSDLAILEDITETAKARKAVILSQIKTITREQRKRRKRIDALEKELESREG